jgi:hypothetical protein
MMRWTPPDLSAASLDKPWSRGGCAEFVAVLFFLTFTTPRFSAPSLAGGKRPPTSDAECGGEARRDVYRTVRDSSAPELPLEIERIINLLESFPVGIIASCRVYADALAFCQQAAHLG